MASETLTPNIGLQIPAYNQANWQVPTDYNWNRLDLMLGGKLPFPALSNFVISNIGVQIAAVAVSEVPAGVIPGNAYTLSFPPNFIIAFYWNGVFQRPGIDYNIVGQLLTLTTGATVSGDSVFVVYLQ